MGQQFEPVWAHLFLSVEILSFYFHGNSSHSSVTHLSLRRLERGQDPAYRATLLQIMRPSHNFVRGERVESVEVFVRLRVNL